jgi:hypothetical protein
VIFRLSSIGGILNRGALVILPFCIPFWHSGQLLQYSEISVKIPGQKKWRIILSLVFFVPKCPANKTSWPKDKTCFSHAIWNNSCPECQKGMQKGRITRAPLLSIPPIEEPFQRITIDCNGPLPLTNNRNITWPKEMTHYPVPCFLCA